MERAIGFYLCYNYTYSYVLRVLSPCGQTVRATHSRLIITISNLEAQSKMSSTNFKDRLRELAKSTDTHGLKFIVDKSSSRSRKVVWSVLVVSSIVLLAYIIDLRVTTYLNYPVSTTVDLQTGDVPLPTVRVCTDARNIIQSDTLTPDDIANGILDHMDEKYRADGDPPIIEFSDEAFIKVDGVWYFTTEAIQSFADNLENLQASSTEKPPVVDSPFVTVSAIVWDVDFVNVFRILSEATNNTALTESSVYNAQAAFLKAAQSSELRAKELLARVTADNPGCIATEVSSHGTAPCNENWQTRVMDGQKSAVLTNAQVNFCWILDTNRYLELMFSISNDENLLMTGRFWYLWLFVEDEKEDIRSEFFRDSLPTIESGGSLKVDLKMEVSLYRQPAPYGTCQEQFEDGEPYSVSTCATRCALNSIASCEQGSNNITDHSCTFIDHYSRCRSIAGGCPPACHTKSFVMYAEKMQRQNFEDPTSISLYSDGASSRLSIHEKPQYPMEALLSELGGMMGLCAGVSILTVAHLLEFTLREVWMGVNKRLPVQFGGHVEDEEGAQKEDRRDNDLRAATLDDVYRIVTLAIQQQQGNQALSSDGSPE